MPSETITVRDEAYQVAPWSRRIGARADRYVQPSNIGRGGEKVVFDFSRMADSLNSTEVEDYFHGGTRTICPLSNASGAACTMRMYSMPSRKAGLGSFLSEKYAHKDHSP